MEPTKKYTVITGASSGIGRETAKAFANRGKNLIVAARRTENLEALKCEILEQHPTLDVVIRTVDLSVLENVYQFFSSLKDFQLETWVNNAGFGNYDSVADFNTALAPTPDELTEFLAAIADVSGTISPDDENYDFFATTMTFSAHELYCEHMGEEFTLFVPMSKQSRPCSYLDEYGETVSIIDSRYRCNKPLIVTTNLKLNELKHPPDLARARIYDRILERCAPILFAGKNFREDNAATTKAAARQIITSTAASHRQTATEKGEL